MTTSTGPTRPVLVVGATGQVGSHVVAALLERGAPVRALLRRPETADLPEGVERVRGDLRDPASVAAALDGVSAAFYVSPHEPDEVALAETFVRACEETGTRIVFAGVAVAASNRVKRAALGVLYRRLLPSYRGKLDLARRIERSSTRAVLLVPTNFMQCDEIFLDEIERGDFVPPLAEGGVNRVDLRDVAVVAARALVDDDLAPGCYPIMGPASLSGAECAAAWSRVLGRPVRYAGEDDAVREAAFARALTGRKLQDWTSSFRFLRTNAVKASAWDLKETERVLGRPPTPYADYVQRVAHQRGGVR